MFILIVLIIMAGIVVTAVFVGLREDKLRAERGSSPQARRNRERVNMAKAAGAFPNRKEN